MNQGRRQLLESGGALKIDVEVIFIFAILFIEYFNCRCFRLSWTLTFLKLLHFNYSIVFVFISKSNTYIHTSKFLVLTQAL